MSNARLQACYEQGLSDELKVIEFLRAQGYTVETSSREDNIKNDIDCWVNGKPTSIKSQHKGVWFRNIGFELANHLTTQANCGLTKKILGTGSISIADVDSLISSGSWEPGWMSTGTATNYLFYQGGNIRLYTKESIKRYVATNGWLRVRPLTEDTRSYLGGFYRHCNTICAYLQWDCVPHRIWTDIK